MKCYLFDIDGTLADLSHRLPHIQKEPKDWDAFFAACGDDKPIQHVIDLLITLFDADQKIVLVSGRSSQCHAETVAWLERHKIPTDSLYTRKEGDHRPDDQVKAELLTAIRADGYEPMMAFDDRDQVVFMWRRLGIPCAQVAPGNF